MNEFGSVHRDDVTVLRYWDSYFDEKSKEPIPEGKNPGTVPVLVIDEAAVNRRADDLTRERVLLARKFEAKG